MNRLLPDDLRVQLNIERAALRELGDTEDVAPDYLRFCGELARFHAHARALIREARPVVAEDAGAHPSAERTRRLRPEAFVVDEAILRRLLGELETLARASASSGGHVTRLAEASASDATVLPNLVAAVARGGGSAPALDALSVQLGVEPVVLGYLGRLLAAPVLAEARFRRGALPEYDARNADPADAVHCPCCHAAPAVAALGPEDGRRRFVCALCGETWIVPRVLCAFCGSRSGLATLRASADEPRWVETCDACGWYLKTVDLQRLPVHYAVLPIVEQAATAHLDVIAEGAGYASLPPEESTTTPLH
ncbi:MAG: formate dehydrogenase accessory protein FdhE [Gemmatimonadaceae bacterium]|jgi:formate dehydrogenase maturation protein FdhE